MIERLVPRLPAFVQEMPVRLESAKREIQTRGASLYLQYWGIDHRLTPSGKEHWNNLLRKFKNRERVNPSTEIGVVDGFDYHVTGVDKLESLDPEKGFLLISNHSNEGPVRGWGQVFVMSHAVKQATGKDIVWAQGSAASGSSNAVRESVRTIKVKHEKNWKKKIRKKLHIKSSGNGITGAKNILRSMKTEAVGIFPEGTQKRDLKKGDSRTGVIIASAARQGIPVVCISTSFTNGEIFVSADILDSSEIQRLESSYENPYQAIVDYTMITIASHLPKNRRGHYRGKTALQPQSTNV
ncbi:MAG: hypothetical protein WD992_00695 [Candidatus Levyibacteriota bacterium]